MVGAGETTYLAFRSIAAAKQRARGHLSMVALPGERMSNS